MNQLDQIKTESVPVTICGQQHEFRCVMKCMAHIAEHYETPQKAIEKLYELCTKEIDGARAMRSTSEMFTVDLMELLKVFTAGLLKHELAPSGDDIFDQADVTELPGIVDGIMAAMGIGQSKPVKGKKKA